MSYYPGEPGYGSVFANWGPTKSYKKEGRNWNTNWMRHNFTREGRGSGMGSTRRLAAKWQRSKYYDYTQRLTYGGSSPFNRNAPKFAKTPLVGPTALAANRILNYTGMNRYERMVLGSLLGHTFGDPFINATEPYLGELGMEWLKPPVGPIFPVPLGVGERTRTMFGGSWFPKTRRKKKRNSRRRRRRY